MIKPITEKAKLVESVKENFQIVPDETLEEAANVSEEEEEESVADDIAYDVTVWAYDNYPDAAFVGEGSTANGNIALMFDLSRLEDKEEFANALKDKFGDKIALGKSQAQYAPEIKHFTVICKNEITEDAKPGDNAVFADTDEAERVAKETTIKDWYKETYPTDTISEELIDGYTFYDLFSDLDRYKFDYSVVAYDSIVRERVFHQLATIMGVPYDEVYDQWLKSE